MPELIINKIRYPIQGILFDKDGTLLDFIYLWGKWSEWMHRHYESLLPLGAIRPASLGGVTA
ncbi:hypothetical protein [Bacillus sp. FJAT-28004]|uniref:hypothetical protein n=1 Tax=Bacillus sp. FJAT-28004 TaxID=1679165 RepID=UPI0006B43B07